MPIPEQSQVAKTQNSLHMQVVGKFSR